MSDYHVTAMLEEAVDMLACRPGKIIVDEGEAHNDIVELLERVKGI